MKEIFESELTSMQSLPVLTTGQAFLHSCLHFYRGLVRKRNKSEGNHTFGLHLSALTMAILEGVSGGPGEGDRGSRHTSCLTL